MLPLSILHIVPLISPDAQYGGPVRGTMRQAAGAIDNGHSATALSLWPARSPVARPDSMLGVPLKLFPYNLRVPGHRFVGLWSWLAFVWLLRHARSFDIVHIHAGRELWVHVAARLLRAMGVPYIWQSHGMIAPRHRFLVRVMDRFFTARSLLSAYRVLYLTPREREELTQLFHLANLKLLINGVERVTAKHLAPRFSQGSVLRLVSTSRLHRRKRIPELIAAVASCHDEGHRIQLTIFGPDEGDLARAKMTIGDRKAGDFVRYAGSLGYDEVRNELMRHHVIALPSVDEPFPNSVLEGMASGLVPIISESCGLAPYVAAANAGPVVRDNDACDLVRSLKELCNSTALYDECQTRVLRLVQREFDIKVVLSSLLTIYSDGVKSAKGKVS